MAPSAMVVPEVSSSNTFDKKSSKHESHPSDVSTDMDVHDYAVGSGGFMDSTSFKDSSSFKAFSGSKKSYNMRASSPTGSVRSTYTHRRMASRILSGSFSDWGSPEFSGELTQQAEVAFKAMTELSATMSKHNSNLKEYWTKVIAERDDYAASWGLMREQMMLLEEQIEKRDADIRRATSQSGDKDRENRKLKDEFNTSNALVVELRGQLATRDLHLENLRRDLNAGNGNTARLRAELEETRGTLKRTDLKLATQAEELNVAKENADEYRLDRNKLRNEFAVLQSSHGELSKKYEATHTKLQSVEQLNKDLTVKNHEHMHDSLNSKTVINTLRTQIGHLEGQLDDMSGANERTLDELHESQTLYSSLRTKLEKSERKVAELHRKLEETQKYLDDSKNLAEDWMAKYKHFEDEHLLVEKHRNKLQEDQTRLRALLAKTQEELRKAEEEKQQVSESFAFESKKFQEHQRKIVVMQESLDRLETSLMEKIGEVNSLTERATLFETERDEALRKSGDLTSHVEKLQSSIDTLKMEIKSLTERSEGSAEHLRESELQYEEIHQSMTEIQENYSLLESHYATLRKTLLDVRAEKEKAIESRESADKERDEANERYEAKCRELEDYQVLVSSHTQSQSNGKSEVRRTISKSSLKTKGHKHVHVTDGATA